MGDSIQRIKQNVTSGDALLSMEGLSSCLDFLGREQHLEKIIKKAVRILTDVFELQKVNHFEVQGRGAKIHLESSSLESKNEHQLEDKTRQQIEVQLRLLNVGGQDYKFGINVLALGRENYCFAMLGDNSSYWGILLWKSEDLPSGMPLKNEQVRAHQMRERIVEVFVKNLQTLFRGQARFHKVQSLLVRDELTGLYNYRGLENTLESEIRRIQRFDSFFSILFIDLDNFKPINDTHGHLAGSGVLKQVAEVLKEELREVDSIFRYGGDEFVVVLLEASSVQAMSVAERIRAHIATQPFAVPNEQVVHITASIGIASCPEHGKDKEVLLKMADDSMYESKKGGKNRVVIVGNGPSDEANN